MAAQDGIIVSISDDRHHAFMRVDGTVSAELLTADLVEAVARRVGVAIDKDVLGKISAAVAEYAAGPREMSVEISTSRYPGAAIDAGITWLPGFDPDAPETVKVEGSVDHYQGRRLVAVKVGDVVGAMRKSEEGADGRDVTGRVLRARAPKASPIKLGHGLSVDAEGRLVADIAGVIELNNGTAKVVQQMHVPGDVDFNTGKIEFTGAVTVSGGIKPCFSVKTTGDLHVGGLVEDAVIDCGGSLDCRRGLTAKDRGDLRVGGDVQAVFMNCIHGSVGGVVKVQREIMNCELEVRGEIRSPRAVLLGGRTTVLGTVELDEIGSENWKETDLVLGWSVRAALDARITELHAAILTKKGLYAQISALGKRATPAQRESITELEFEMWGLEQELQKYKAELERHLKLVSVPVNEAVRFVMVHGWIHPKARICIGKDTIAFTTPVRGPIRICLDHKDRLVGVVDHAEPRLLTELAKGVGKRKAA